jgi:hypothetical protein
MKYFFKNLQWNFYRFRRALRYFRQGWRTCDWDWTQLARTWKFTIEEAQRFYSTRAV